MPLRGQPSAIATHVGRAASARLHEAGAVVELEVVVARLARAGERRAVETVVAGARVRQDEDHGLHFAVAERDGAGDVAEVLTLSGSWSRCRWRPGLSSVASSLEHGRQVERDPQLRGAGDACPGLEGAVPARQVVELREAAPLPRTIRQREASRQRRRRVLGAFLVVLRREGVGCGEGRRTCPGTSDRAPAEPCSRPRASTGRVRRTTSRRIPMSAVSRPARPVAR